MTGTATAPTNPYGTMPNIQHPTTLSTYQNTTRTAPHTLVNNPSYPNTHTATTLDASLLVTPTTTTPTHTAPAPNDISALITSIVNTNPALATSIMQLLNQHNSQNTEPPSIPTLTTTPERTTHGLPPPTAAFTTPPRTEHNDSNRWFVVGPRNTSTPINNTHTDLAHSPEDEDEDADNTEITLSQSDFAPSTVTSGKPSTSISINQFVDLHTSTTPSDDATIQRRLLEGRVNRRDQITRRCVVIKLAQSTQYGSDQAHTLHGLEGIIDGIVASLPLQFRVDRVAILQFDKAIQTRKYGTCYFSYAFLSPHSSHPKTTLTPTPSRYLIQKEVETLQSSIHSRLDGPDYFNGITDLPHDAYHFRVNMPFTNEMDESFCLLVEGITAGLLFGQHESGQTLTGRYLGYQIFNALKETYPTVPPHQPLPRILTKLQRRFDIGGIISVKKVRYSKPKPQGKDKEQHSPKKSKQEIYPLLGIIIANNPTGKALHDALTHVCITHNKELVITGNSSQRIAIMVHEKPAELKQQIQLARDIGSRQGVLHKESQFSIVRDIRVHSKILSNREYITRATGSYGHCLGFLFDFSRGTLDLRATAIFLSFKDTSFITAEQISSRIIEVNNATVNLTPIPLASPESKPPSSLRSPLGRHTNTTAARTQRRPQPTDRSSNLFRVAATSQLALGSSVSHKFYAIVNGIGGIATANVYNMDFDVDGIRSLITHVPYNRHSSFPLEQEAWTYLIAHFPHIRSPDDATYMNENCPSETTNLTNPSRLFQEKSGLRFSHPGKAVAEFTYFDNLPDEIKLKRIAGSHRMKARGLTPIDGYTFEENYDNLTRPHDSTTHHHSPQTNGPTTTHPPPPSTLPRAPPVSRAVARLDSFHFRGLHDDSMSLDASRSRTTTANMSLTTAAQPNDSQLKDPPESILPNNENALEEYSQETIVPGTEIMTTYNQFRCDNSITGNISLMDHSQSLLSHQVDDADELSTSASQLQITQTGHKRSRQSDGASQDETHDSSQPQYIIFNAKITDTSADIFHTLMPDLDDASIPPSAYLEKIDFMGFPSVYNYHEKLGVITVFDPTMTDTITDLVAKALQTSFPRVQDVQPTLPSVCDIDTTQFSGRGFPRYCQVRTCPFHNGGKYIFRDTPAGVTLAQEHGRHVHGDLLNELSTDTLKNIGWRKCCPLCPELFLITDDLDGHRRRCFLHDSHQVWLQQPGTSISPSRTGVASPLYLICPNARVRELDRILQDDPLIDHASLYLRVSEWYFDSIRENSHPTTDPEIDDEL